MYVFDCLNSNMFYRKKCVYNYFEYDLYNGIRIMLNDINIKKFNIRIKD